jgi:hypothetical protein
MSNLSTKIIKILLWVLMGVTIIFAAIFYLGDVKSGTLGTRIEEPVITQGFLVWTYILFFVTAGITVVFSIMNFVINPKGAKKSIVFVLAAVVVIVLAYLMADDTVLSMPHYDGKDNVPSTLRFVGTGIITAYILVGLAFLAIVYSAISRVFK